MTFCKRYLQPFFLVSMLCLAQLSSSAQNDTIPAKEPSVNSESRNNLLKNMINNFRKDTTEKDLTNELKRNDEAYNKFAGLIIRNIFIKKVPFGTAFSDTSRKFMNKLTNLANDLHHITKTKVV